MATKYWTGSGSTGALNDGANWSPAGAPAASDTLILATAAGVDVVGGDYTAIGALNEIRITRDFTDSFGSSAALVQVECPTITLDSGGPVYLDTESSTRVAVLGSGVADMLTLSGDVTELRVAAGSGTITIVQATGTTTSSGYTELTNLFMLGSATATITLEASVSGLTTLTMDGGTIDLSCNCTTARSYGGTLNVKAASAITTAEVFGNGRIVDTGTGTITTLTLYGGSAEFSNNASDGVTVTNCAVNNGTLDLSTSLQNITFTNDITVNGGTVLPPLGSTLGITY